MAPTLESDERIVAVIPTFNEAGNVANVVRRVRSAVPGAHLLIVDDLSPDGTGAVVRSLPGYGATVHLLSRDGERGLGNAYRAGFAWAAARDYTVVLQLDADLSHPPEALPALIEAVTGPDPAAIAIGSRYVPGGGTQGWPRRREVISRAAGAYVRAVLRLPVADPTAGFKAYRATTLKEIDVATTTTSGYGFQVECLWRAYQQGLRIVEGPITFVDRVEGSSKMTLGVAVEAASKVLRWRLDAVRHPVLLGTILAALVAFGLHLFYLRGSLLSDEGGFAMVARWWDAPGGHVYGAQWVDRPPGLIAVFWLADQLGLYGPRLMAGVCAAIFVLAAGWAGWALRGRSGARWATVAGLFLVVTPVTQTFALNGELIASTWTMVAVAAALTMLRSDLRLRSAAAYAALAGSTAALALLTKQNFADAAAFVAVLGLGSLLVRGADRPRLLRVGGVAVAGFAVPIAAVCWWAAAHTGLGDLIYALYGFRVDAAQVMAQGSLNAAHERRSDLLGIAIGTGLIPIGATLAAVAVARVRRLTPLLAAVAAASLIEIVGVVAGGNFWAHYLIGLSPMLVVAAAVLAPGAGRLAVLARVQIVAALIVGIALTPVAGNVAAQKSTVTRVSQWLSSAAAPGDTGVVLYSHANVLGASGLRPTYPYAWSLPVRTRDPQLRLLERTLTSPATAPTWVIGWDRLTQWGLDADQRIEGILARDYVRAATVCRRPIWLHRGQTRTLPVDPCAPQFAATP